MSYNPGAWKTPPASVPDVAPSGGLPDMPDLFAHGEELAATRGHPEEGGGGDAEAAVLVADPLVHGRRDHVGQVDRARRGHAQHVAHPALDLEGGPLHPRALHHHGASP